MQTDEPVKRTVEIEEWSNRVFIHPISGRLAQLCARLRLTPNAVSLTGMLLGVLAGVAYYHFRQPWWAVIGFLLMIGWHIMDGADGQLARLTGQQSQSGKIIDGICDYVTFIAVYVALGLALQQRHGHWIWLLIITAGVFHAVQAAAYEVQRQDYNYWGLGRASAALPALDDPALYVTDGGTLKRLAALLYRLYVRVQHACIGMPSALRARLRALLAGDDARRVLARQQYRALFAPAVRRWSVLSANYRTLGLFIAAVLQIPLAYFVFEIIGFSICLLALSRSQRPLYATLQRQLTVVDTCNSSQQM